MEGIVTLEDLLEEIVGEIDDEYDLPDESFSGSTSGRSASTAPSRSTTSTSSSRQEMPQEDYHTLAGFVFGELGRAPEEGDEVDWDGLRFERRRGRRRAHREAQRRVPPGRRGAGRGRSRPDGFLYSTHPGPTLPTAFAGPAAPPSWPRPRAFPRPERLEPRRRDAARRGAGARQEARQARPADDRRPARAPASPLRGRRRRRCGSPTCSQARRRSRSPARCADVGSPTAAGGSRSCRRGSPTSSGEITAVWFNQAWLVDKLQAGHARAAARASCGANEFTVRSYDLNGASRDRRLRARLPGERGGDGQEAPRARRRGARARARRAGRAPAGAHEPSGLPPRADALRALHRPETLEEAERGAAPARLRRAARAPGRARAAPARAREETAPALGEPGDLVSRYRELLPFELTPHQERAIAEIDADLAQADADGAAAPGRSRLGQDRRRALRAPPRGRVRAEGRADGADRDPRRAALPHRSRSRAASSASGRAAHALGRRTTRAPARRRSSSGRMRSSRKDVDLERGRRRRRRRAAPFRRRAAPRASPEGRTPHVLHMTATPIPRTLALTVYGDLSVSEIAKPPANRKPVKTAWVTEERSSEAYKRLRKHLDDGRQAYVVCPLIEESETSARAGRRARGRAPAKGRAERLPRRPDARTAAAGRAARADGAVQGARARRARRDDRDRGRRRRSERDDHDRPGGRPLRPRAAAPAARPGGAGGRAVVLPARLTARRRS